MSQLSLLDKQLFPRKKWIIRNGKTKVDLDRRLGETVAESVTRHYGGQSVRHAPCKKIENIELFIGKARVGRLEFIVY